MASQEQNVAGEGVVEESFSSNFISGVLDASKDVFLRTVSYDFSQAFFKRRSLGSEERLVLLNGVPMNKLDNGRANWSNWGGLNDALRNQEIDQGIMPSDYQMGKLGGIVNINSPARLYNSGFKASVAASNRTYSTRWMMTYGSSWLKGNWKINASASTRFGEEGYREGTPYESYSILCSVDKKFFEKHYLNLTAIVAYNKRGLASPMTEEVFSLKGPRYNSYWGLQEGVKRNERLRSSLEPIVQLNYRGFINPETSIGAHLTCQFGSYGTTRLDYGGSRRLNDSGVFVGGGVNPDPSYYQKLPSYFLRNADFKNFAGALYAAQDFTESGQINWNELYLSNTVSGSQRNSVFALYEDRNQDFLVSFQGELFRQLTSRMSLRGSFRAMLLRSRRHALMKDLLGGAGYLDIDPFDLGTIEVQNNLKNPNRIVSENDRFRYDYEIEASDFSLFVQAEHRGRKEEAFLALGLGYRNYRRNGLYENGSFPGDASLGKGSVLRFNTFGLKGGFTYKFNGRQMVEVNGAFLEDPPAIRDSYSNPRENHQTVIGLRASRSLSGELIYRMRLPRFQLNLGTFLWDTQGASHVTFYYADGLTGLNESGTSAFVQEIKTGIGRFGIGTELGFQFSLTDGLKFKGAAAAGIAYFSMNPDLYLTSDDLEAPVFYGPANLRGYRIPNGPQEAFSIGLEYSDPDFWWVGVTFNSFRNSFLQVAPVTRTKNFFTDSQGLELPLYDEQIASELLQQERLPDFNIVNLVGGKSWRIKSTYIGFFVSIGNVLNTVHQTGGFEQSRNANYETLLEDRSRDQPLFGPKYWYGFGTTFFTSIYIRTQ